MKVQWRSCANGYEASNQGGVRNLKGRVLHKYINSVGYEFAQLSINKKKVTALVHRLVLTAFCGPCPAGYEADHINRKRTDNRLENLRWLTRGENIRNRPTRSASGVKGVQFHHGKSRPWQLRARLNGRKLHLGYFATKEEAAEARRKWEREHGFLQGNSDD